MRCVFRFDGEPATYQERITLWRAASFEAGIALAESEAREYARDVDCTFLDLSQAYLLADEISDGAEVFSLMRDSDLGPEEYLDHYFETGTARQLAIDS